MRVIIGLLALLLFPAAVFAQEDIEPRVVGARGMTTMGLGGFIDGYSSSEETFPVHFTVRADVSHFLTGRIAIRGGLLGSTTFRDDADEVRSGPGAAALHALIGGTYYFTPQSMLSLYGGLEYRAQLSRRAERDSGTVLGLAGVEAAVSSRARLFLQGGYGARLTRGDDGELQTRITAEVGVRIKF